MMKKLISIVLTICMLFSLITVTTAAEISEDERLALLKEKDYTFININPNIDAFASIEVIRDYAPFYSAESADASSAYNAVHDAGGYTYMTRIPSFTHGGLAITGNESYYKKGMGYFNIDEERIYSSQNHSPFMFATESFKLSADELKNYKFNIYKNVAKATTAKAFAANPAGFPASTTAFPNGDNGYDYMPNVVDTEYVGSNYNVILKDNDTDVKIKIGPINDKDFVANAVDHVGGGRTVNHSVAVPEGVKGNSIAIAATVGSVNNGGSVSGLSISPGAALLPIEITYADGDVERKQMVITSMANKNDMVSSAIVFGDKYDGGREIDYKTETGYYSSLQFMPANSGLTFADVKFPENVSAGDINFGFAARGNQHEYYADFSNMVNLGTFPLKDKEISTIKYVNDSSPGDNNIEGTISFTSTTGSANVRALVPVEIKNGDADKVYFLYLGRITQQPAIFATTVINASLQEKIDAINAKLELVDENTTEADCEAIDKAITALKAESDLVKDSDFITDKYELIKEKLLALAQRKIAAVEAAIEGLADTYTYEMKAAFTEVYADYVFLFENGIEESAINPALNSKIKALYAQFEKADKLEKMVAEWDEYSYTMYEDVVAANEAIAEMEAMVSEKTATDVKEYYETATTAKTIDNKIKALADTYSSEMLEDVLAIEKEANEFVEKGGNEGAFEFLAKLENLVKSAAEDILVADVEEVSKKLAELPKPYSTEMKAEIEAIVAAVASIEERGGELPADAQAILDEFLAQKNEAAFYVTTKLNYTRDIFEDVKKYAAQGYADKDKKVYVYPSDAWHPTVTAQANGKFAFDEAGFMTQFKLDDKNVATVNGIPYQFGPVLSKVNGVANEPNSINNADCSNGIEIPVEELPYEELYLVAWSKTADSTVAITYNYTDGTSSAEATTNKIKGGISGKPTNDALGTVLNASGITFFRAYSATAINDQTYGWGGYSIYVSSHFLRPNDKKVLKSISIIASDKDVNILALTGKVANSGIVSKKLDASVAGLAGDNEDDEIRKLVGDSKKYMEILDAKGVAYNETYAATVQQYAEEYITVDSVECYTDTDNRNITVTFSGAIADECITKNNFVLKKDGVVVANYNIEKISANIIKITVKNAFDYECAYSLEISGDITNDEKTVALGATEVYDYDGLAAVDVKVTYENNKININVKNNLTVGLDNFVVMTGAFDKDNALIKLEPVSGALEAGEEFNQSIDFNASEGKITCTIIDTLDNAKLLFNPIAVR